VTTIIAFILMFGLLVSIHEWGHLIFAKKAGMLAREFAIGFGPKIFSFTRNETLYTIRLVPAGGYVRVAGDDPEIIDIKPGHHIGLEFNESGKVDKIIVNNKDKHPNARVIEVERVDLDHDLAIEGYEIGLEEEKLKFNVDEKAFFIMDEQKTQIAPFNRQFASKTVGQRAMQLFAGPLMNFLLAIVIFIILGFIQGVPIDQAVVGEVQSDSPAEEVGMKADDEIISVNDKKVEKFSDVSSYIIERPGEELSLKILRDNQTKEIDVVPKEVEQDGMTIGQIGVLFQQEYEKSFFKSLTYGFTQTLETTQSIVRNLVMLITGQLSIEMLSGPVGIYDLTDQVVKTGFTNFLMLTAMLSVNLGIINLVPLPALDGGRLLFVGIEAVRGKPVSAQKEGFVHFVGFALLILLMLVVTWNDIQRLFM